jgi:AcrR family transcriptional regulator
VGELGKRDDALFVGICFDRYTVLVLMNEQPEKRRKILSAARILFAQKRYDEVTVPEIVKLAGVAQGTFYRYFPSKTFLVDALGDEVQHDVAQAVQSVLREDKSILELIEPLIRAALGALESYKDVLPFLNTDALLFGESAEAEESRKPFLEMITELIARGQKAKKISADMEPQLTARLIDGIVSKLIRECLLYPDDVPTEAYIKEAVGFMRRALKK